MARPYTADPMQQRIAAAITLIRRQARGGPYAALHFAVFARAAHDAISAIPEHGPESAALYLEGAMPHLEHCGVHPPWARSVLSKAGLRLGSYNAEPSQDSAPPP